MPASKNDDVREFLSTRRGKVTPEMAGLPAGGGARRVPGLRREEVALLAGVSVDYYSRIEKGNLSGVSDEVLDALARALQLNEDELSYLYDLARTARRPTRRRSQPARRVVVPEQVQLVMDSMRDCPVLALTPCLDVVGANALGRALFDVVLSSPTRVSATSPVNMAAFVFLDPAAAEFYAEPDDAAATCVQALRAQAGANPNDARLTSLIGQLSTRSELFRTLWAAHDVKTPRSGQKTIRHREVGDVDVAFEQIALQSAPSVVLSTYLAAPGSASAERLAVLAAWAATERVAG